MRRCGLGLGRQARSAELDELPISREVVSFIGSNAGPSIGELVTYEPVRVPKFGYRVLRDDSVTELKLAARELRTVFFDLVSIVEPRLHVTC